MNYFDRNELRRDLLRQYPKIIKSKGVNYLNLSAAFDIETTSTTREKDDSKMAFMYVWMLGIGHSAPVIYGRTWSEFVDAMRTVQDVYALDTDNRLVIYVHNLAYEFQFMYRYFDWHDVFAVSERKPIKAVTACGIEFRDSYILSGYSLSDTAKNLTKHTIAKLDGELDYDKVRHSETPLTAAEMAYCENDVQVVTAYIDEQIAIYGNVTNIPMTNTGRVRQYIRECCYTAVSKGGRKRRTFDEYRTIMDDLTLDDTTYNQLKRAFMGGFTHANAHHVGKKLNNVSSIDFTSAYPSVMLSERFPMSRFKSIQVTDETHLTDLCKRYAVLFDVRLTGLRSKITQEAYISESKCLKIDEPVVNNGRVVSADEVVMTITNVDFDIIRNVYEWDSIAIANVKYAHLGYLPKPIIRALLKMYQDKTQLKGVKGKETEYLLSKGMLNSIYGMCVTDIVKDRATFDGVKWEDQEQDINEELTVYNESANRVLYYPWGIWVTAYARRNLWTGILAMGDDYVYSDTDSLKMLGYNKHIKYIQWFNKTITVKMETMCEQLNIDKSLLSPKTIDGVTKQIGVWDYEGEYSEFKTLGAKRYMVRQDGVVCLTVAGLSKQEAVEYMESQSNDVFDQFSNDLYIPAANTGKNSHTYINKPSVSIVTDYTGNSKRVMSASGIHLEPCSFTMAENKAYIDFLTNLGKGYIYTGLKHV